MAEMRKCLWCQGRARCGRDRMEQKQCWCSIRQSTWSRAAYVSMVGEEKGGGSRVISRYVTSLEGGRFRIEETTQSSLS